MAKLIYRSPSIEELFGSPHPVTSIAPMQAVESFAQTPLLTANLEAGVTTTNRFDFSVGRTELLIACAIAGLVLAGILHVEKKRRTSKRG